MPHRINHPQSPDDAHTQPEKNGRTKHLTRAFALCVWLFFLARCVHVFTPDSVYVQPFNSDSALPVLMSNDRVIDPFRFYIYGQDQFGAYPFILAQLASRATGYVWTLHSVYVYQTIWVFIGVLLVASLMRTDRFLVGIAFLLVLCLNHAANAYIFLLGLRYPWELTALFLAWLCLRRVITTNDLERPKNDERATTDHQQTTRRLGGAARITALYVSSLAAIWMSPASLICLCVLVVLELARARLMAGDADAAAPPLTRSIVRAAAPLAAAALTEFAIRFDFRRHALKHFGRDYRTPTALDWGHFADNLRTQLANLRESAWWLLVLVGVVATLVLLFMFVRELMRAKDERAAIFRDPFFLDAATLVVGSTVIAVVNFLLTIFFLWFRLNAFGRRYLSPIYLFGSFAGLLALCLLIYALPALGERRRALTRIAAAVCLALLLVFFPGARRRPDFNRLQEIADTLAERAPGVVLLGGYWQTYIFAGLQPRATLVPVPIETHYVRTPWTPQRLREARQVLVVEDVNDRVWGEGFPAAVISQHGARLRLVEPRWYENGGYTFALYENEGAR